MWKDFHRLPERDISDEVSHGGNKGMYGDDITHLLALSAFLRGEVKDAAQVLEPFLPKEGRVAVDAAMQARDAAEQLNTRTKMKHAYEKDPEGDVTEVMQAIAHSGLVKDEGTASQIENIARQHREMQAEINHVQTLMEKMRNGDTGALLMEVLGSRVPGMENMGNMMNMMNMMSSMNGTN